MTIVGALVRIDEAQRGQIWEELSALPGVTPFQVTGTDRLGALLEVASPEQAYDLLHDRLGQLSGVMGVFPVYVHYGEAGPTLPGGVGQEADHSDQGSSEEAA